MVGLLFVVFLHYTFCPVFVKPPWGMKFLCWRKTCQDLFFGRDLRLRQNHNGRKNGQFVETAKNSYVNGSPQANRPFLWKKAVEKPVEIVEKFGFSTAKRGIFHWAARENRSQFPEKDCA